ncbi:MAG: hypothetical protein A2391_03190 [Candidatus Brennerbacteria bacterium RIFOXYB1_FULL_41_13]|nr:MAG: hypothetical protein A2391_03190 [Candidatus Brennerbacteria bacterium RIFOXYB1_FULL_41_13]
MFVSGTVSCPHCGKNFSASVYLDRKSEESLCPHCSKPVMVDVAGGSGDKLMLMAKKAPAEPEETQRESPA